MIIAIDALPSRRILLLGTLIALVTLAFFIYGYRLEYIYDGNFALKKLVVWNNPRNVSKEGSQTLSASRENSNQLTPKEPDYMCYKNEPSVVLENCLPCSKFEQNAVKSAYCQETGFYDKLNCTKTKRLGIRPCYDKTTRFAHFNLFTLFCALTSAASYGFVNWRQSILNSRNYMRIRNQLGA